jgi:ElaB/YqjD/DUF883 family membrane-anchored ribosome-binding protein
MTTNSDDITTTAKHNFEDAAALGRSAAGRANDELSQFTGTFRGAVDKSLKDQPMTTLAMAAGMGLLLGALWKR